MSRGVREHVAPLMCRGEREHVAPLMCGLSRGVREHVAPLMAGLMEKELAKQMQFDGYFPASNMLQISTVIVTLHVVRATFLRCYIRPDLWCGQFCFIKITAIFLSAVACIAYISIHLCTR